MVRLSQLFKALSTAALLLQTGDCHPGHDVSQEIAERNTFFKTAKRDLNHCSESLRKRGVEDKQRKRRQVAIEMARAERGLPQSQYSKRTINGYYADSITEPHISDRDLTSVTNTSHLSALDVTPTTAGVEEIIFSNASCILSPEGEMGPFCESPNLVPSDVPDECITRCLRRVRPQKYN